MRRFTEFCPSHAQKKPPSQLQTKTPLHLLNSSNSSWSPSLDQHSSGVCGIDCICRSVCVMRCVVLVSAGRNVLDSVPPTHTALPLTVVSASIPLALPARHNLFAHLNPYPAFIPFSLSLSLSLPLSLSSVFSGVCSSCNQAGTPTHTHTHARQYCQQGTTFLHYRRGDLCFSSFWKKQKQNRKASFKVFSHTITSNAYF